MGYFDVSINSQFEKMADGRLIFYPYWKFGIRYIISNDDEVKIRQFLKRYYLISLPATIATVILFNYFVFVLLFFLVPFYLIKITRMLSHSEKIREKMTLKDRAISMGIAKSIFSLVLSLLVTGAYVLVFFLTEVKLFDIVVYSLGILIYGIILLRSIVLVRYAIKFKREEKQQLRTAQC